MEKINEPMKLHVTEMTSKLDPMRKDFIEEMSRPLMFDNASYYRLRSNLVELIEEIKMRRVTESENEERIQLLVHEKYELERQNESERHVRLSLADDHDQKLDEQKRHFEDKMHTLKEQIKKIQIHRECTEKETKSLKDEIRSLQWMKYTLEKKLREQEHKMATSHSSAEHQLQEISTLEKKMSAMMSQYQHLSESQKCLEKNGKFSGNSFSLYSRFRISIGPNKMTTVDSEGSPQSAAYVRSS